LDTWLDDAIMQNIAAENNLSETLIDALGQAPSEVHLSHLTRAWV